MTQPKQKNNGVRQLVIVLTAILVVLKAFKLVSISWILAFSPVLAWLALIVLVSATVIMITLASFAVDAIGHKKLKQ